MVSVIFYYFLFSLGGMVLSLVLFKALFFFMARFSGLVSLITR